jgi:hypothetical protein
MPSAGFLFASQPVCLSRNCSDLTRHVLGCPASLSSGLGLFSQRFSSLLCDEADPFRNQQSRTAVKLATIVLLETLRL